MSDDEDISIFDDEDFCPKWKLTRGERKARKMLSKNNGKHIENVSRVVFRQNDGSLFVIENPEVYKHSNMNNNTFIVFGEAVEVNTDPQQIETEKAAMNFETSANYDEDEEDESTEIDESDLKPLDIELVMSQAKVSRRKAIIALRKNNNDLVNTIMDLT